MPAAFDITLNARRIRFALLAVALLLSALSLGTRLSVLGQGEIFSHLPRLLSVGEEYNLPT